MQTNPHQSADADSFPLRKGEAEEGKDFSTNRCFVDADAQDFSTALEMTKQTAQRNDRGDVGEAEGENMAN